MQDRKQRVKHSTFFREIWIIFQEIPRKDLNISSPAFPIIVLIYIAKNYEDLLSEFMFGDWINSVTKLLFFLRKSVVSWGTILWFMRNLMPFWTSSIQKYGLDISVHGN